MSINICMPGHNDWYQISVDPFDLSFHPYPFKSLSMEDAALHTLEKITEKYDNLYLGLSGGYDSEFIAKVMLKNNISFTPLIFKDVYSRESDYAIYFCKKNNITPIIIEKNMIDSKFIKMLSNISKRVSTKGGDIIASINIILANIADKNNGHFLTGGGISTSDLLYPKLLSEMTDFTMADFYVEILFNKTHPGAFFCYTPEILYSYLKNINLTLPTQEAKSLIYDIPFRPKLKPYHVGLLNPEMNKNIPYFISKGSFDELISYFNTYLID